MGDRGALHPALELAQHQVLDHPHAGLAVVEARDVGEILAAGALEVVRVLDRDLLQRLEAIGRKAGRDHGEILDPLAGQTLDGPVRRTDSASVASGVPRLTSSTPVPPAPTGGSSAGRGGEGATGGLVGFATDGSITSLLSSPDRIRQGLARLTDHMTMRLHCLAGALSIFNQSGDAGPLFGSQIGSEIETS